MPQNFIASRREQGFLLPPDVREWLAADHLAWFVIDAVTQMGVGAFYASDRADGHGRAAYEPSMMVTLLMYAYATKQRSSRATWCLIMRRSRGSSFAMRRCWRSCLVRF